MSKPSLPSESESISALFDESLTEEEAQKAIDLLLSDENAQEVWFKACAVADIAQGHQPDEQTRFLTQRIMTQINTEQTIQTHAHGQLFWVWRKINKLYAACPRVVWRTVGFSVPLVLLAVIVWGPGLNLDSQSDFDAYTTIDSPLNSMSLQQGNQDNEMTRYYLEQHQNAIINGL